MKLIARYKKEIAFFGFLTAAYFLLRLLFLGSLPMFTDEAIYVRWAQIALQDASWRFISLTDGKQPMYVWVAMLFLKIINDPLIAGRLVSVISGFFTMLGLFVLAYELFKSKSVAYITAGLYVVFPFAQVLDRMALYDSMVSAFAVWALYLSVLLVKKINLSIAYTLSFVIAGGILTKTSNFFSIYLLPFALILFDFKKKPVQNKFIKWIFLAGFASLISYIFYNALRLSPLYGMIAAKNATFVYPFSEWLEHPFTFFIGNMHGLSTWLIEYLNFTYIFLILISLIFFKRFWREKLLLIVYFILPFTALALFGRIIFPRFIFFMSLYLLPLAAWGLNFLTDYISLYVNKNKIKLPKKIVQVSVIFIFVYYSFIVSIQFAIDPINAHIAKADSSQYVNSWAAGWGIRESVDFFKEQAKNQKIYVATEGTFGLLPEAMEIYLLNDKNITIKGYWPVDIFPKEVLEKASKMPTYFIFYQREHLVIPSSFPLKLLFKVRQGNSNAYYRVYQIIP